MQQQVADRAYLDLLKKCLTASIYPESAWQLVEGPMQNQTGALASLKRRILRALNRRNLILVRARELKPGLRENGIDWPLFGMTMTGTKRLNALQHCIEQVLSDRTPGDYVETGVWRGGSSIFAKALFMFYGASDRVVWCCDSFEGMPKPGANDLDLDPKSDFSDRSFLVATQAQVAANFQSFGLLDNNVRFLKGWFKDTLPTAPIDKISVLRLDGDLYESTMDALTSLYRKVSDGGFVIVDDYGSWPGCKAAIDEFRQHHKIIAPLQVIDQSAVYWHVTPSNRPAAAQ